MLGVLKPSPQRQINFVLVKAYLKITQLQNPPYRTPQKTNLTHLLLRIYLQKFKNNCLKRLEFSFAGPSCRVFHHSFVLQSNLDLKWRKERLLLNSMFVSRVRKDVEKQRHNNKSYKKMDAVKRKTWLIPLPVSIPLVSTMVAERSSADQCLDRQSAYETQMGITNYLEPRPWIRDEENKAGRR